MIHIRQLSKCDFQAAIAIKEACWKSDYKDIVPLEAFSTSKEIGVFADWFLNPGNDFRLLFGAFFEERLVGFIGAGTAEIEDSTNGVEVNSLFVESEFRRKGIGTLLIKTALEPFHELGYEEVVVYNWHDVPSNRFYRHIGGTLFRKVVQYPAGKALPVDIFRWDLARMQELLTSICKRRHLTE
ncbi:GNAT family N-acetyltransferase [Marispirochaeta sp.]|uniref:GNAT family N-acetyltransferase n=1 Tax=Marispirochaeta sp. TaxID=2038653 RepID=UPI0029C682F2|nr:GNAT family N-acetyltransferase [Marispirochaeta sp.]